MLLEKIFKQQAIFIFQSCLIMQVNNCINENKGNKIMEVSFQGNIKFINPKEFALAAQEKPLIRDIKHYLEKRGTEIFADTPADDVLEVSFLPKDAGSDEKVRLKYIAGKASQEKEITIPETTWYINLTGPGYAIKETVKTMDKMVRRITNEVKEAFGQKIDLKSRIEQGWENWGANAR